MDHSNFDREIESISARLSNLNTQPRNDDKDAFLSDIFRPKDKVDPYYHQRRIIQNTLTYINTNDGIHTFVTVTNTNLSQYFVIVSNNGTILIVVKYKNGKWTRYLQFHKKFDFAVPSCLSNDIIQCVTSNKDSSLDKLGDSMNTLMSMAKIIIIAHTQHK